ncbi:undecaprenyl-diphosphatase [Sporanaerobium hydrogeniformans]|uniref:Undecaprenyl-diphosphatase n=1 Tax=Sporanaerobium hydrogeniformans TaxID=3072179 RepID=A0AC61D996_9FIRM|nr:undecaprenyl-diphosphate phosphatase [Sporanaerobium hydrogeniformans]PHV69954.1 undecaprenyl-diphosphatase [Sporanaerobium hydrogeniformans]
MDLVFIFKAALLGIVEGITEFLPISSTGHLIIFSNLLGFYKNADKAYVDMFNMVIQLGAILAVVVLYRKKIMQTVIYLFPSSKISFSESCLYFWLMIVISCLPGSVVVLLFNATIKENFFNPLTVAIALFVGGFLMLLAEAKLPVKQELTLERTPIHPWQALVVGLFQVLAIIPGMSRSASTIIGGWLAGFSTLATAEYSFFLAIPVMCGETLLNIFEMQGKLSSLEWLSLGVGFTVSFIVALLVIDSFITFLKKKSMSVFAVYRIVFAFVVLSCGVMGLF